MANLHPLLLTILKTAAKQVIHLSHLCLARASPKMVIAHDGDLMTSMLLCNRLVNRPLIDAQCGRLPLLTLSNTEYQRAISRLQNRQI